MLKQLKDAVRRASDRARERREFATLLDLDDHLLKDIGIRRSDVRARLTGRDLG